VNKNEEEKKSLKQNKIWILVPRIEAKDRKILSNKWIFHVKDGRYKTRIIVRETKVRI